MGTFPKLSFACPIPWAEMQGGDTERFCSKCSRSVVNLSALTEKERVALFQRSRPGEICVAYYKALSGEYISAESQLPQSELIKFKQFGYAALSAGAFAVAVGCAPAKQSQKDAAAKKEVPGVMIMGMPVVSGPEPTPTPTEEEKLLPDMRSAPQDTRTPLKIQPPPIEQPPAKVPELR